MAHRDVKPENVLCVRSDRASPIKLDDFDLSSKESTLTTTPRLQTLVGSLEYMAPEVSRVQAPEIVHMLLEIAQIANFFNFVLKLRFYFGLQLFTID